jgi:uncharacterized protein
MKAPLALAVTITALAAATAPASAQSFSCMETGELNATEAKICRSRWLGNLDERLAFWYGEALNRARHFDQTGSLRSAQRQWIASRDTCGSSFWCIRSHYQRRIRELKNYAEHV